MTAGSPTQDAPLGSSGFPARPVALAFLGLALVAGAAPYSGEAFGFVVPVEPHVEVVDHVLPAAVVLLVAAFVLVVGRFPFACMLLISLAGLWITATHFPLLLQARTGSVEWPAALWHSLPGVAILLAGLKGAVKLWPEDEGRQGN